MATSCTKSKHKDHFPLIFHIFPHFHIVSSFSILFLHFNMFPYFPYFSYCFIISIFFIIFHIFPYFFIQVIIKALCWLPESISSSVYLTSPATDLNLLMYRSKQANAALAALGGFKETIKPGCLVQVSRGHCSKSIKPGCLVQVSKGYWSSNQDVW